MIPKLGHEHDAEGRWTLQHLKSFDQQKILSECRSPVVYVSSLTDAEVPHRHYYADSFRFLESVKEIKFMYQNVCFVTMVKALERVG